MFDYYIRSQRSSHLEVKIVSASSVFCFCLEPIHKQFPVCKKSSRE
jgi:hypothetical protein